MGEEYLGANDNTTEVASTLKIIGGSFLAQPVSVTSLSSFGFRLEEGGGSIGGFRLTDPDLADTFGHSRTREVQSLWLKPAMASTVWNTRVFERPDGPETTHSILPIKDPYLWVSSSLQHSASLPVWPASQRVALSQANAPAVVESGRRPISTPYFSDTINQRMITNTTTLNLSGYAFRLGLWLARLLQPDWGSLNPETVFQRTTVQNYGETWVWPSYNENDAFSFNQISYHSALTQEHAVNQPGAVVVYLPHGAGSWSTAQIFMWIMLCCEVDMALPEYTYDALIFSTHPGEESTPRLGEGALRPYANLVHNLATPAFAGDTHFFLVSDEQITVNGQVLVAPPGAAVVVDVGNMDAHLQAVSHAQHADFLLNTYLKSVGMTTSEQEWFNRGILFRWGVRYSHTRNVAGEDPGNTIDQAYCTFSLTRPARYHFPGMARVALALPSLGDGLTPQFVRIVPMLNMLGMMTRNQGYCPPEEYITTLPSMRALHRLSLSCLCLSDYQLLCRMLDPWYGVHSAVARRNPIDAASMMGVASKLWGISYLMQMVGLELEWPGFKPYGFARLPGVLVDSAVAGLDPAKWEARPSRGGMYSVADRASYAYTYEVGSVTGGIYIDYLEKSPVPNLALRRWIVPTLVGQSFVTPFVRALRFDEWQINALEYVIGGRSVMSWDKIADASGMRLFRRSQPQNLVDVTLFE